MAIIFHGIDSDFDTDARDGGTIRTVKVVLRADDNAVYTLNDLHNFVNMATEPWIDQFTSVRRPEGSTINYEWTFNQNFSALNPQGPSGSTWPPGNDASGQAWNLVLACEFNLDIVEEGLTILNQLPIAGGETDNFSWWIDLFSGDSENDEAPRRTVNIGSFVDGIQRSSFKHIAARGPSYARSEGSRPNDRNHFRNALMKGHMNVNINGPLGYSLVLRELRQGDLRWDPDIREVNLSDGNGGVATINIATGAATNNNGVTANYPHADILDVGVNWVTRNFRAGEGIGFLDMNKRDYDNSLVARVPTIRSFPINYGEDSDEFRVRYVVSWNNFIGGNNMLAENVLNERIEIYGASNNTGSASHLRMFRNVRPDVSLRRSNNFQRAQYYFSTLSRTTLVDGNNVNQPGWFVSKRNAFSTGNDPFAGAIADSVYEDDSRFDPWRWRNRKLFHVDTRREWWGTRRDSEFTFDLVWGTMDAPGTGAYVQPTTDSDGYTLYFGTNALTLEQTTNPLEDLTVENAGQDTRFDLVGNPEWEWQAPPTGMSINDDFSVLTITEDVTTDDILNYLGGYVNTEVPARGFNFHTNSPQGSSGISSDLDADEDFYNLCDWLGNTLPTNGEFEAFKPWVYNSANREVIVPMSIVNEAQISPGTITNNLTVRYPVDSDATLVNQNGGSVLDTVAVIDYREPYLRVTADAELISIFDSDGVLVARDSDGGTGMIDTLVGSVYDQEVIDNGSAPHQMAGFDKDTTLTIVLTREGHEREFITQDVGSLGVELVDVRMTRDQAQTVRTDLADNIVADFVINFHDSDNVNFNQVSDSEGFLDIRFEGGASSFATNWMLNQAMNTFHGHRALYWARVDAPVTNTADLVLNPSFSRDSTEIFNNGHAGIRIGPINNQSVTLNNVTVVGGNDEVSLTRSGDGEFSVQNNSSVEASSESFATALREYDVATAADLQQVINKILPLY